MSNCEFKEMRPTKKLNERKSLITYKDDHRFKAVATVNHPSKNPNSKQVAEVKFAEVCEAFDVLSQSK